MKIALLLSGLPRMWRQTLPTQLALFPDARPDVYFHFWDTIDTEEKTELLELLKPKAYLFQPPQNFDAWDEKPFIQRDFINIPSRLASQFYSWKRAGELFAAHVDEYDCALRCRSDMQFVYSVDYIAKQIRPNDLVVTWAEKGKLLNDMFAIGDPKAILYYHTLYDHLEDYARERVFNPEVLLEQHLVKSPVPLHVITDEQKWYFIRRPHMGNYSIEQCMAENPAANKWFDKEIVEDHKKFHTRVKGEEGAEFVERFRQNRTQNTAKID